MNMKPNGKASLISRIGGPTIVIFIGGIITACGAVWASQIGAPTIVIFIGGIITACGAVWASSKQNKNAERLQQKNDEIIALNRLISNTLTGGDSFCYLSPVENIPNAFFVNHVGAYPLYDVVMSIRDFDATKGKTAIEVFAATTNYPVGSIAPNSCKITPTPLIFSGDYNRLSVSFSARNGFFYEDLRLMRLPSGKLVHALQVKRHESREPVLTKISDDFPKSPDGTIDWN